jgi:hypothetical protein
MNQLKGWPNINNLLFKLSNKKVKKFLKQLSIIFENSVILKVKIDLKVK